MCLINNYDNSLNNKLRVLTHYLYYLCSIVNVKTIFTLQTMLTVSFETYCFIQTVDPRNRTYLVGSERISYQYFKPIKI